MKHLHELIISSIENTEEEIWFPKLTPLLTHFGWQQLIEQFGINKNNYTTEAVLTGKLNGESIPFAYVQQNHIPIYAVPTLLENDFISSNFKTYDDLELKNSSVLSCVQEAFELLDEVPSITKSVTELVANLHLLKPENSEYDVSCSFPNIPFSIFVSVPAIRTANDALRLAEGILHESMHLQLTLIDYALPLIRKDANLIPHYSPWKNGFRHPLGVIHALYVFKVVYVFLQKLYLSGQVDEHRKKRMFEINKQIQNIIEFKNYAGFTQSGSKLIERLFNPAS